VTAAQLNAQISGNLLETAVAKVTTQGDIPYATGANALTRLPKGTAYQKIGMNAGATAPEWQNGGMELIQNVALSGSSVSFTSIPSGFKHLKMLILAKSSTFDPIFLTFNGDGTNSYNYQALYLENATFSNLSINSGPAAKIGTLGGNVANHPGTIELTIPGYLQTNMFKSYHSVGGVSASATQPAFSAFFGTWLNLAAITRIDLATVFGTFQSDSNATLYGIR